MKLVGNQGGMTLYPKMIKEAAPTKHKYGADVTWSAHTDTYKPTLSGHGIDAEINAFKNNLQLTILITPSTDGGFEEQIKSVLDTGRFSSGLYFRAFLEEIQEQVDWYHEITGKLPSYWSYGNGTVAHDDFFLSNGLVSRSSGAGEVGYDFDDRVSHRVASLFNYDIRDKGSVQAFINSESYLRKAIEQNGWYNDFSHWHWAEQYGEKNQLEQFLGMQKEILNGVNYVSLGAGEAVEYMWLRKQFKRGGLYQDGNELVLISDVRNENELPYKTINTTLSVEVDLSGTILSGKEIVSTNDTIKVDANKYIVQVPYSNRDGFRAVRLKETTKPRYMDFSLPVIQAVDYSSGKLRVQTDKLTNVVLFSVPVGGSLHEAEIVQRSNVMNNVHEIELSDLAKDLYIGAITKEKQSVLSDKYNFNQP